MSNKENETFSNLINAINIASYDVLIECLKQQIKYFKNDITRIIDSIDSDHWYQLGQILKELQQKTEILSKFCEFIEYVGLLQGILEENKI